MAKASRPGNQAVAGIAGTSTTSPTFYKTEAAGSAAGSTKSSSSGTGSSSNKSSTSNKSSSSTHKREEFLFKQYKDEHGKYREQCAAR